MKNEKNIVELTTAEKKKIRIKKKEEADTERATKYNNISELFKSC